MRRLHLVPIEPMQERYSSQWYTWFRRELVALGHEVNVIDGQRLERLHQIKTGQFLDVFDTNFYKASQAMILASEFRVGTIRDSDVILFLDAWNPVVLQAAYMRDATGVKCRLAGLWHAGTYDPHDFITQRGMQVWGTDFERSVASALEFNFFATEFHKTLFRRRLVSDRCIVTGFPLYPIDWQKHSMPWIQRPLRVVFPHRLAPEKQPDLFDSIREVFEEVHPDLAPHVEWVRTKDVCTTKQDYYRVLGSSRVAVSTALQETWGIAMLEAASLGCHIVAPNQLSYAEIYEHWERYQSLNEAAALVYAALRAPVPRVWDGTKWEEAIGNISRVLEGP